MKSLRVIPLLLVALVWTGSAQARDPLGTAGPLRSTGWAKCDAGIKAQLEGACDPLPVDTSLPGPQQSKAHVERTIALLGLLRMQQARESLDAAIRADDRNVAAYKLRARINIPGNGSAENDITAGLALDPNDSDLVAMRATIFEDRDRRAALREATRAVALKRDNADALWIRAGILLRGKQFAEAEADLTRALSIEPDVFRIRHLRAAVRLHRDHFQEAIDDANIVLRERPGEISALHVRAMARAGLRDFAGLVDDLTAVLGEPGRPINADPSGALFNGLFIQRAIALVRIGRPEQALQDIDVVVGIGGQRAVLRMQVYLRSHGFPDVALNGKRSDQFDDAMKSCFIDQACGRGIAEHI